MVKYEQAVDRVFYGLSHPVRREILQLIGAGECPVTELAGHFDLSLPAISRHIKVLERARLVHREKRGRAHRISLNQDALLAVEEWLATYRAFWNGRLDSLEDYLAKNQPAEKAKVTR